MDINVTCICQLKSANRDIDVSFCSTMPTSKSYLKNDLIGPEGIAEFYFISGAPQKTQDYLTIFKPFDHYIWGLLIASIMTISVALSFINKMQAIWSKEPAKESVFQSME